MQKKPKFARQAHLPEGAYTLDFKEVLGPYMKKNMADFKMFQIIKKKDDTFTTGQKILRISIGGSKSKGFYLVYRGDLAEVRELIGSAFRAMSVMNEEPKVMPEKDEKWVKTRTVYIQMLLFLICQWSLVTTWHASGIFPRNLVTGRSFLIGPRMTTKQFSY